MQTESLTVVAAGDDGAYDASRIAVLSGLDAVRATPGMYVGSNDEYGLHRLGIELIDNALDEVAAGFCSSIDVCIHRNGSLSVRDNGRGIPVDIHPKFGRPACELVLTTLHAGAKFDRSAYRHSAGRHGVGLACVNALSERLTLHVWRSGRHHMQRYRDGRASPLRVNGATLPNQTGTCIRFLPDRKVFGELTFSYERLAEHLRERAYFYPDLEIHVRDERTRQGDSFRFATGLAGLVEHLNRHAAALHADPVVGEAVVDDFRMEFAFQWTDAFAPQIQSFVNSVRTANGGTHEDALKEAIVRALSQYACDQGLIGADSLDGAQSLDWLDGVTAVIAVWLHQPQFEGQTKTRLQQPAVARGVRDLVTHRLGQWLVQHPRLAAAAIRRTIDMSHARSAAGRAVRVAAAPQCDGLFDEEVFRRQFAIRSGNWHESAQWITSDDLLAAHAAMCRAPKTARLLDVCCGSGVVGAAFRERVGHTLGLDLTPQMAELARTRLDEVRLGNVYSLPFSEGEFDLVVTREVLHILPRPALPLAEICRVLKPGGQLIFGQTLPYGLDDAAWMWRIFKKKQPLIFNQFLEEDLVRLLQTTGFVGIEMAEQCVWESIDVWIDTHETSNLHREEIRRLYHNAPAAVRAVHPFTISPTGEIRDCWRWGVFSAFKPSLQEP